jgi:hypothetical protein
MLMTTRFLEDLLIYRAVDFLLPDRLAFTMKARNGSVENPIDTSGSESAPLLPSLMWLTWAISTPSSLIRVACLGFRFESRHRSVPSRWVYSLRVDPHSLWARVRYYLGCNVLSSASFPCLFVHTELNGYVIESIYTSKCKPTRCLQVETCCLLFANF